MDTLYESPFSLLFKLWNTREKPPRAAQSFALEDNEETGRTFKVFVQDVLEAVEDGFVVFDFVALAGVRPALPALEVGVDFTRVGGVLFVMGHLQAKKQGQFGC